MEERLAAKGFVQHFRLVRCDGRLLSDLLADLHVASETDDSMVGAKRSLAYQVEQQKQGAG